MKKILYILLLFGSLVQAQLIGVVASSQATGTEIFPQDNAAAVSDDNAVGSWDVLNAITLTSDTASPYDGTYCIKGVATDVTSLCRIAFSATLGKTYTVVMWAKTGTNVNTQQFRLWQNINETVITTITGTTWTEYTHVVTPVITGTIDARVYAARSGTVGDEVYIDLVSIIEN